MHRIQYHFAALQFRQPQINAKAFFSAANGSTEVLKPPHYL